MKPSSLCEYPFCKVEKVPDLNLCPKHVRKQMEDNLTRVETDHVAKNIKATAAVDAAWEKNRVSDRY